MATQYILVIESDFIETINKAVLAAFKEAQAQSKPDNTLLTQLQTAEKLKISIPTLLRWKEKKIIPYTQIGRKIFFKSQDVLNSLDSLSNKSQIKG